VVVAPLASLLLCPVVFGDTTGLSPSETPQGQAELARVIEPPELKGVSVKPRIQPTAADLRLIGSKALKADPDHPETLAPALKDLNDVIAQAPGRSDLYWQQAIIGRGDRSRLKWRL
jgi:hypothetical protein